MGEQKEKEGGHRQTAADLQQCRDKMSSSKVSYFVIAIDYKTAEREKRGTERDTGRFSDDCEPSRGCRAESEHLPADFSATVLS